RQMFLPVSWQFTVRRLSPKLAELRMLFRVPFDEFVPVILVSRSTIQRFPKMGQRLIRHEEFFVFRPTQISLCFADRVFAWRIAVRLTCAGGRHAIANGRLNRNERWLID